MLYYIRHASEHQNRFNTPNQKRKENSNQYKQSYPLKNGKIVTVYRRGMYWNWRDSDQKKNKSEQYPRMVISYIQNNTVIQKIYPKYGFLYFYYPISDIYPNELLQCTSERRVETHRKQNHTQNYYLKNRERKKN